MDSKWHMVCLTSFHQRQKFKMVKTPPCPCDHLDGKEPTLSPDPPGKVGNVDNVDNVADLNTPQDYQHGQHHHHVKGGVSDNLDDEDGLAL